MSLEKIKNSMPTEKQIEDLADLFKVLGDKTRSIIMN